MKLPEATDERQQRPASGLSSVHTCLVEI